MTPSAAIEHLIAAGMTEKAIGTSVGAGQSTINRIRHGRMHPAWAVGDKLVRLARTMSLGVDETQARSRLEEHGDNVAGADTCGEVVQRGESQSERVHGFHEAQHRGTAAGRA